MLPIHAILNPNGKHVNEQYRPQIWPRVNPAVKASLRRSGELGRRLQPRKGGDHFIGRFHAHCICILFTFNVTA
jgi:hypothetical protein